MSVRRRLTDMLCAALCLGCGLWAGLMFAPLDCGGLGTVLLLFQLLLFVPLYLAALALLTLLRPRANRLLALALLLPSLLRFWPAAPSVCQAQAPWWLLGVMLALSALAWVMPGLRRRYG